MFLTEQEAEQRFDEMLDDVCGVVKIAGYEYNTSHALKKLDSIAYREEFLNWLDSEGLEEKDDGYCSKDE